MNEEWTLSPGHSLDPWGWGLVVVAAGLAVYELATTLQRPSELRPSHKFALIGLRLVALAALLALALELNLRLESRTPRSSRILVLVDSSASMELADAPERLDQTMTRRWERFAELWRQGDAARRSWAEAGMVVELRHFDELTTPWELDPEQLGAYHPQGVASKLGTALSEVSTGHDQGRTPVAAIVVVSDGLVAPDDATRDHVQKLAESLRRPVTTIAVGGSAIRDVAISDLGVGEFAFVENVTEFELSLTPHGYEGRQAKVRLTRDGATVAEQQAHLGADGVPVKVRFKHAPDRTGSFVYAFEVEDLGQEATLLNNHRRFVLKVLRDKVRVLHVAGRPDWDVRALRTLLRRDPNVELLSYYILRDRDDSMGADRNAPMSLIAFPTDEIFRSELGSFDLVIMHNFDAALHGNYLGNIADYVEDGGSLIIIGGDMGLATGEFAQAKLAALLPVDTSRIAGHEMDPFRPQLTEAGRRHPITAWLGDGWGELPQLDSFNPTTEAPASRYVQPASLLRHPDGAPLLSVGESGKGRTVVFATGSSWRLGFAPDVRLVDGARPYDLLWLGTLRWLLRDDAADRLLLESDEVVYRPRQSPTLRARTLSPTYAPEAEVEVEWAVRPIGGSQAKAIARGRWTTNGLGRASTQLEQLPLGAYRATARRVDEERPEATASRVFIVDDGGRELAKVDADAGRELLQAISEATGGEFVDATRNEGLPTEIPTMLPEGDPSTLRSRRDIPLWNHWLSLLVLFVSLPGEWWLRRRAGFR